jgi:Zn/Cd-binding protein ZinT
VSHKRIKIHTYKFNRPERITAEQNTVLIEMKDTDIDSVFQSARINSTSRNDIKDYWKWKFKINIENLNLDKGKPFLKYVRDEYRKAMHSKRNNLLSAWVYKNVKS